MANFSSKFYNILHFLDFSVKPYFSSNQLLDQVVVAGATKNIRLKAIGNPPEIEYSWKLPPAARRSHVQIRNHVITIFEASKAEAGRYEVSAANSYGDFKTTVAVSLQVLFPPK